MIFKIISRCHDYRLSLYHLWWQLFFTINSVVCSLLFKKCYCKLVKTFVCKEDVSMFEHSVSFVCLFKRNNCLLGAWWQCPVSDQMCLFYVLFLHFALHQSNVITVSDCVCTGTSNTVWNVSSRFEFSTNLVHLLNLSFTKLFYVLLLRIYARVISPSSLCIMLPYHDVRVVFWV